MRRAEWLGTSTVIPSGLIAANLALAACGGDSDPERLEVVDCEANPTGIASVTLPVYDPEHKVGEEAAIGDGVQSNGDTTWRWQAIVKTDNGEAWVGDEDYLFPVAVEQLETGAALEPVLRGSEQPHAVTARFTRDDAGRWQGVFSFYCDESSIPVTE